jgi:hypothetical protein
MKNVFTFRVTGLGMLSWLIPFMLSFLFFDSSGQLLISQPLFKSLMVVAGGGFAALLLVLVFRRLKPSAWTGLALGLYWLAINLGLDLAILVPFAKMSTLTYFYDIGVRYLLIPIFSTAVGSAAGAAVSRETIR